MAALIFLDFTVFPVFNAVVGTDVGAATAYPIRYAFDDYKAMLAGAIDPVHFAAGFPQRFSALLTFDSTSYPMGDTGGTFRQVVTTNPLRVDVGDGEADILESEDIDDYEACPFIPDPDTGDPTAVHQTARVQKILSASVSIALDLFHPAMEEADWDAAAAGAGVWLKFSIGALAGWQRSYQCDPPEGETTGGLDSAVIPHNFLGIDDTGGVAFPGADASIPLGDGTTSAYFLDPGTPDKLVITDIHSSWP